MALAHGSTSRVYVNNVEVEYVISCKLGVGKKRSEITKMGDTGPRRMAGLQEGKGSFTFTRDTTAVQQNVVLDAALNGTEYPIKFWEISAGAFLTGTCMYDVDYSANVDNPNQITVNFETSNGAAFTRG